MDIKEIIQQLESLKTHCNSMITEYDEIWEKDVQAIVEAIKVLKKLQKK